MTGHSTNSKKGDAVISPDTEKKQGKRLPAFLKLLLLVLILAALFVLARMFGLGEKVGDLRGWIESLGAWGYAVFALIYITAVVAMLPGSAVTVLAGTLFGSVIGIILVSIASTAGAILAFLVSRYFARQAVAQWLGKKETFVRLDRLTEQHGAVIVALTRLVPIFPFNILNYGFGLTSVKFRDYALWSWICMLPGTILYVAGADAVTAGLEEGRIPWGLIGVVFAVLVFLVIVVRIARKKLAAREASTTPE